jgi:hypothetical protein
VNDRIYVTGGYVAGPNAEVYYSSPLTGIAEQPVTSRPSPFAIFPNPVRSGRAVLRLTLGTRSELPPNSVMSLRVLDASGRVLQSRILDPKSQIDLTLPAGVYLIRLDAGGFSANQKLVVQ